MAAKVPTRMIVVRRFAEVPSGWDTFVRAARSPWHSSGMARLQEEFGARPLYLVGEEGGEWVGVLSLWIVGSRRFRSLNRLFARKVLVPDEPAITEDKAGVALALLEAAESEARRLNAVAIRWNISLPQHLSRALLQAVGYGVTEEGAAVLELPRTAEELASRMHYTARKQVRKAERAGIRVETSPDVSPLLPLLDLSFQRSGLPSRNHDYVRRTQVLLGGEVLVARKEQRAVAALLWAPFGEIALNIFHGRQDGDTEGGSNLLHREMFARALDRGVRLIHSGGAALGQDADPHLLGITQFKRKMGFEVRTALRAERVLRPAAASIGDMLSRVWGRLAGHAPFSNTPQKARVLGREPPQADGGRV